MVILQDLLLAYIVATTITFLLIVLILNRILRIIKTMKDREPVKINILWYILLYSVFLISSLIPVYGQIQLIVVFLGMKFLVKHTK